MNFFFWSMVSFPIVSKSISIDCFLFLELFLPSLLPSFIPPFLSSFLPSHSFPPSFLPCCSAQETPSGVMSEILSTLALLFCFSCCWEPQFSVTVFNSCPHCKQVLNPILCWFTGTLGHFLCDFAGLLLSAAESWLSYLGFLLP